MDLVNENQNAHNDGARFPELDGREFDSQWYIDQHPDVRKALNEGVLSSALEHYLTHGREEGRDARFKEPDARPFSPIVHLHIPKTAGTSLRRAFKNSGKRMLEAGPNFYFCSDKHGNAEVISGHFGYWRGAMVPNSRMITVLRDPVDRFISYYYHLIQLYDTAVEHSERTTLAKQYTIDEFVYMQDHPGFNESLFNGMAWQIAHGSLAEERSQFRLQNSPTDDDLLLLAQKHLNEFALVGFHTELERFTSLVKSRFAVSLEPTRENVTVVRPKAEDLSVHTRRKINDWVYLDVELFWWANAKLLY